MVRSDHTIVMYVVRGCSSQNVRHPLTFLFRNPIPLKNKKRKKKKEEATDLQKQKKVVII